VTGADSLAQASTARKYCVGNDCQPSAQSHIDTSKTLAWASDIGLGIGIVGVAVGTILFFTSVRWSDPSTPASLWVVPELSVGHSSAMASWQCHFR
jgi:hypothetical protein